MLNCLAVQTLVDVVDAGSWSLAARRSDRRLSDLRATVRALATELGVDLLSSGDADSVALTLEGRRFLPRARVMLADAERLGGMFRHPGLGRELRVICSHYLASFLLIDRLRQFRARHPGVQLKLSVRTEVQILSALLQDSSCGVGFCAPLEFPEGLRYRHWFAMDWALVVPATHAFAGRSEVAIEELGAEPLIVFEAGSTGRQHLLEAFHRAGLQPAIALQATTTALIVQMVEAELGIAVLPLLPSGRVTRDRKVVAIPLREPLQPIASGVFVREEWEHDPLLRELIEFVIAEPV